MLISAPRETLAPSSVKYLCYIASLRLGRGNSLSADDIEVLAPNVVTNSERAQQELLQLLIYGEQNLNRRQEQLRVIIRNKFNNDDESKDTLHDRLLPLETIWPSTDE